MVENLQATIIRRRSRPFRGKCCLLHRHQPSSDGRKYGRHFRGWKQWRLRANYTQSSHWPADCWVLLLRTWDQRKVLSERGSPIDSGGYTVAVATGPLKLGGAEERIKKCLWDHYQRRTLGWSGKRMRLDAVKHTLESTTLPRPYTAANSASATRKWPHFLELFGSIRRSVRFLATV